jgi:hypothetical protein
MENRMFNRPAPRVPLPTSIPIAFFTLLLFACGDSTPAPTAIEPKPLPYEGLTPPSTIVELLTSLKIIAQHRLWDRDDFYAKDTLQRLFGTQEITISTVPGRNLSFQIYGFKTLLAPRQGNGARFSGVECSHTSM